MTRNSTRRSLKQPQHQAKKPSKLNKLSQPKQKPTPFAYAIKSFLGYLEGTQKSALTIKNYFLDVQAFQNFMVKFHNGRPFSMEQIHQDDVERYRQYLKNQGFKTNTRRRKLLTVTQFLSYLSQRKKTAPELIQKIAAPAKIERVPFTVSALQLVQEIRNLPTQTLLDYRNRTLLWTLAETGCQVSEVTQLRFEDWEINTEGTSHVMIRGKASRSVPVSLDLYRAVEELQPMLQDSPWIFSGFNKYGSLGAPMSARGVELLVRFYGPKLGFPELTPRTFRHSVILHWFETDVPQGDIQNRLGLRTTYAFRSYVPLLKDTERAKDLA